MVRVKGDTEMTVRFLAEPDQWKEYWEHYTKDYNFFPCNTGDCVGCEEGHKPSYRVLAPVIDLDERKVVAVVLPKSIIESLVRRYDKAHTVMDRDFTIVRIGTGQNDTTYELQSEGRKKRDLSRFEIPDLEEILVAQIPSGDSDDEDDEDENFLRDKPKKKTPPTKKTAKAATKRRVVDEDDDDDDDDDDFDDDEEVTRPKRTMGKKRTMRRSR